MARTTTHPPAAAEQNLSAECSLAACDGYQDLHDACTRLKDIPTPGAPRITLMPGCGCACHRLVGATS